MEIIEALVAQETGDFDEVFANFVSAKLTPDEVVAATGKVENLFLKVKDARQKWHGAAYIKLGDNADKKAYRELYGLTNTTLNEWATTVNHWYSEKIPPGRSLSFTHYRVTNPLAKLDKPRAIELLEEAEEKGYTKNQLSDRCVTERQKILVESKAQRIKAANKGLSIGDARKRAAASDESSRQRAARNTIKKKYEKAKEVVQDYEDQGQALVMPGANAMKPKDAISLLYKLASKTAHPDKGGSHELMASVTEAKEALLKWVEILP